MRDLVALRPSEEHLPLRCTGCERSSRGTLLWLAPRYVCPTASLAERMLLLDGAEPPRVTTVAAPAHDLLDQSLNNRRSARSGSDCPRNASL